MSTITTYPVDGMTCAHCVQHVTDEITKIDGVEKVDVELNSGGTSRVTVTSAAPLAESEVAEAVDEAGYSLSQGKNLL